MPPQETDPLLPAPPTNYSAVNNRQSSTSDAMERGASSTDSVAAYKKQISPRPDNKRKQSSLVTVFSVWNTVMGSSLLTMAWGVERAGLGGALALVALMAALCLYTAHLLLGVSEHHGGEACEVPALCRALLGRVAEGVAHVFSVVVLLGANVVYWILITNFLYFTVNYFTDVPSNTTDYNSTLLCPSDLGVNGSLLVPVPVDAPYWGLHSTVPIYVAAIVYPLLNFKNVSFFTKFNSLGTLSVVYLIIWVMAKGWSWGVHLQLTTQPRFLDAAALSGVLALSFYIHNIIITIMSNNAKKENNGRDLTIAFVLVTLTYILVGTVFYVCFPLAKSCIEDNMLNNIEKHDVTTAVARILLLFQVVTVFPLIAYMLRVEALLLLPLAPPLKGRREFTFIINAANVLVCILVACFCPNIGTIIRYTGAVSGLVHIFALPALLQMRSLQLRGKLTCCKTIFFASILAFGTINFVLQFFITE